MTRDERILALCAQLFRAENPSVIDAVADQLHITIEEYVSAAHQEGFVTLVTDTETQPTA